MVYRNTNFDGPVKSLDFELIHRIHTIYAHTITMIHSMLHERCLTLFTSTSIVNGALGP